MKILSWNVNGLRAIHKKGCTEWLFGKSGADIIFLQEIKCEKEQLPEELQNPTGFHGYFNSSKLRKGYSGVALYSREKPDKVSYDLKINSENDLEGRIVEAHFGKTAVFGVYFPNGGGESARLKYKLDFYDAFLDHVEKLRKKGFNIIFCGDVNVAHEPIDLARPKENEGHIGFLPEERAWIDALSYSGYVDIWRHNNPNKVQYSWWDVKTSSRDRNIGWRIDYFFVGNNLVNKVKKAEMLNDVMGSDHCPLVMEISI